MNKPLTPRTHGAVDYGLLLTMLTVPRLLRLRPRARALFASFGLIQGTLNAFTQQPLAIKPLVPFKLHGKIEKSSAPIYALAPVLTGVVKEPRARAYWLAMGAVLIAAYNFTDWDAR